MSKTRYVDLLELIKSTGIGIVRRPLYDVVFHRGSGGEYAGKRLETYMINHSTIGRLLVIAGYAVPIQHALHYTEKLVKDIDADGRNLGFPSSLLQCALKNTTFCLKALLMEETVTRGEYVHPRKEPVISSGAWVDVGMVTFQTAFACDGLMPEMLTALLNEVNWGAVEEVKEDGKAD